MNATTSGNFIATLKVMTIISSAKNAANKCRTAPKIWRIMAMINYSDYLQFLRWVYPDKSDKELIQRAKEYMKLQDSFYRRESND